MKSAFLALVASIILFFTPLTLLFTPITASSQPTTSVNEPFVLSPEDCSSLALTQYVYITRHGLEIIRNYQLGAGQTKMHPDFAAMWIRYWNAAALTGREATVLQLAEELEKECKANGGRVSEMFTDPKYFREPVVR